MRLLISEVGGKPVAMLYRPVSPGNGAEPISFTSPVKTVKIDHIEDVSADFKMESTQEKNDNGKVVSVTFEL